MNWEAFGTISNIIVVGALVIITAYYAREVRKQTVLAEKDRMKNKILEEINDVLTPTIYSLDKEITAIDKKKFFWYKAGEEGIFDNFSKIYGESYAFKDVFRKFPELEKIYRSHDSLYEKLNGLYTEIEVEIRTPKLKECIKKLVDKFNQSKEEVYKLRWDYFRAEKTVGYYIINNYDPKRSPDTIEPHIDFWEENKDELMKFRKKIRVKELEKEIEGILKLLKELDNDILAKIKEIRENYRVEYNFTKYEIDPKLKELEEWLNPPM